MKIILFLFYINLDKIELHNRTDTEEEKEYSGLKLRNLLHEA